MTWENILKCILCNVADNDMDQAKKNNKTKQKKDTDKHAFKNMWNADICRWRNSE